MNPLDLRGPEFLLFYVAFGAVILIAAAVLRSRLSGAPEATGRLSPGTYPHDSDAPAIALLRGGRLEAARTLLGRLVAAGTVQMADGRVSFAPPSGERLSGLDERAAAALETGMQPAAAESAIARAAEADFARIEEDLGRQGLLSAGETRSAQWRIALGALAILLGVGLAKLLVAQARGHRNVGFLILLGIAFAILSFALLAPRRVSPAGKRYLAWLRSSHAGLVSSLNAGQREAVPGELALAAGIFGLAAVTVPAWADLRRDLSHRLGGSGHAGSSDGGCGSSSDGGASGSSCGGGSCGGGGCGGGGCGGCGS